MFVAAAIGFPVVLLLAVLGMERVEHRLNTPRRSRRPVPHRAPTGPAHDMDPDLRAEPAS